MQHAFVFPVQACTYYLCTSVINHSRRVTMLQGLGFGGGIQFVKQLIYALNLDETSSPMSPPSRQICLVVQVAPLSQLGCFPLCQRFRKFRSEFKQKGPFWFLLTRRSIRDHLWRWSTFFGRNIPTEIRCSSFDKPVLCPNQVIRKKNLK